MTLQRLVLIFKPEGVEIRALYRTKQGPNPGTKARQREATELARDGLTRALETLEGGGDLALAFGLLFDRTMRMLELYEGVWGRGVRS